MQENEKKAYQFLKDTLFFYSKLSTECWNEFITISKYIEVNKNDYICRVHEKQNSFYFVQKGLIRSFIVDDKGKEYNKAFFNEGMFPGSMVALLRDEPSSFEMQALEDSFLIKIDFKEYRKLLNKYDDLKWFHINYLEANWLIKKESREVSFVQKDANERYEDFLNDFPELEARLTQYHIAAHLGITPTQLSRIRKKINICK